MLRKHQQEVIQSRTDLHLLSGFRGGLMIFEGIPPSNFFTYNYLQSPTITFIYLGSGGCQSQKPDWRWRGRALPGDSSKVLLEHFHQICSAALVVLREAVFWAFGSVLAQLQTHFGYAPSPKPCQKPKILASQRYIFSVNALRFAV